MANLREIADSILAEKKKTSPAQDGDVIMDNYTGEEEDRYEEDPDRRHDNAEEEPARYRSVEKVTRTDATKFWIHPSMYENKGVIVQFINHNCHDMTSIFGGVRLKLETVTLFPEYLAENEGKLKAHAVAQLHRHLLRCQCIAGANETLTIDDYSVSYSIATISNEASLMNPNKRREGPIFYCHFPNLLGTIDLDVDMGTGEIYDYAHVINLYIHLLDPSRRRNKVVEKLKAEAAQKAEAERKAVEEKKKTERPAATVTPGPPPRKTPRANSPRRPSRSGSPKRSNAQQTKLQRELDLAKQQAAELKKKLDEHYRQMPIDMIFPPAPTPSSSTPIWMKDDLPEL